MIFFVFNTCVLFTHAESNLNLNIIQENVQDAKESYNKLSIDQKQAPTARLWIHVSNPQQHSAVTENIGWLNGLKLDNRPISVQPIQTINNPPTVSQLRFFKPQDKKRAEALKRQLDALVVGLQLKDFSREYQNVKWISPGHFELWLARDIRKLKKP